MSFKLNDWVKGSAASPAALLPERAAMRAVAAPKVAWLFSAGWEEGRPCALSALAGGGPLFSRKEEETAREKPLISNGLSPARQ